MTSILWQKLYWGWVLSEVVILLVTRTWAGHGEIRDRGSLLLLWPVICGSNVLAMWYGDTHTPTMFGGAHWIRVASLAVLVLGLVIRWIAIFTLGKSFSANVAIHATQTVHKSGLFRFVRHPSYTGLVLILFAAGLYTRSWLGLAVMAIVPTAALLYRIHVEEIALREAFGSEYEDYSSVTRRLIPGVY